MKCFLIVIVFQRKYLLFLKKLSNIEILGAENDNKDKLLKTRRSVINLNTALNIYMCIVNCLLAIDCQALI